ncbi:phosphate ABC transporter permease subunit PstC [Lacticaseibacillus pantheris]
MQLTRTNAMIQDELTHSSRETRQDTRGRALTYLSIGVVVVLVVAIIYFIAARGVATFTTNHVTLSEFFGTNWQPTATDSNGRPEVGALPMMVTSFSVTILAALVATPFALSVAMFMTDIAERRGAKLLQAVIELLVGIPSVVYGFIGLAVVVPFLRRLAGGTGFGILAGTIVLCVMVLPTVTSLAAASIRAVPLSLRQASYAMGATRWQTLRKVVLRAATPGIITAIILGMARAFGEALAVQMVIGNTTVLPRGLFTPTSTLTSTLTTEMGNTVPGTLQNNVLWSLALILLAMSLVFNLLVRLVGRKGALPS